MLLLVVLVKHLFMIPEILVLHVVTDVLLVVEACITVQVVGKELIEV